MRARTFFYVSVGILCLVVAYSVGAQVARADFEQRQGSIVGFSSGTILRRDGTLWHIHPGAEPSTAEWLQDGAECGQLPPGVTINDIVFWDYYNIITTADVGWLRQNACNGWVSAGPIPTPPVGVQSRTWSNTKRSYR